MTRCKKCGSTTSDLTVRPSLSPRTMPYLSCTGGCQPGSKQAAILTQIAQAIDIDELTLSDEARDAMSLINAAVARQDKRNK